MRPQIDIDGLSFDKNIRANEKRRRSFFELAEDVFGLSFEPWFAQGYWMDKYTPYALFDGDRAVANVSVNLIDLVWPGVVKHCIQIGTVMTASDYRRAGLARYLMDRVLADWRDRAEAVYLFANDSVLDFYPKFGFHRALEYQSRAWIAAKAGPRVKLNMSDRSDRELLSRYYQKSNPFSALPMIDNRGLMMFHCSSYLKDCIYHLEDYQAVVIAEQEAGELICYDVYTDGRAPLADILSRLVMGEGQVVRFGFALKGQLENASLSPLQNDEALFFLSGRSNFWARHKLMFPLLSHA